MVRMRILLATTLLLAACGAGEQPPAESAPATEEVEIAGQGLDYWRAGLTSSDAETRRITALGLGMLGAEAVPLVPDIIARLGDDVPEVATTARQALLAIGEPALEDMLEALASSEDRVVRAAVARTLAEYRPVTPAIVAALGEAAVSDEAWQVRFRAVEALGQIGPEARAAEAQVSAALQDEDANVQAAAAAALERLRE